MVLAAYCESSSAGEEDHSAHAQSESTPSHPEHKSAPPRGKAARARGVQRPSKSRGATARQSTTTPTTAAAAPSNTRRTCTSADPSGKLGRASADAANARSQRVDDVGNNADREKTDELVRLAQGGDRRALEALLKSVAAPVLRMCRYYLGNGPAADDAVQDTFVSIVGKIGQFKFEGPFEAWAKRAAAYRCLNILRQKSRQKRHESGISSHDAEIIASDIEVKPRWSVETRLALRWARQQADRESQSRYHADLASDPSLLLRREEVVSTWARLLITERLSSMEWDSCAKILKRKVAALKMARHRFRTDTRKHLLDRIKNGATDSLQSRPFADRLNLGGLLPDSTEFRQIIDTVHAVVDRYDFLRDEIAGGRETPDRFATPEADRWLSRCRLTTTTLAELLCIKQFHRILAEEIGKGTDG